MKEALFYLSNISIIGYLVAMTGKQLYEARKLKNWQLETQEEFVAAESQMKQGRQEHLDMIAKVYGNDVAEAVANGSIYEEMPFSLLLASLGQPDKVQDGNYKGVMTSKFYYGQSINRLGNPTYHFEVTLENYKVVGWKELK